MSSDRATILPPDEQSLVMACMKVLQIRGCVIWRQNQGAVRTTYKGRKGFLKFTRGQKGISDIIGVLPGGRFLAVEVKVGKNTTSEHQDGFLERVNRAGGLGIVVYSIEELISQLEKA